MITCEAAHRLLSADVDDELPASEAESLRRHLEDCEGCARKRATLERTRRAYRSSLPLPAPSKSRIAVHWWVAAAALPAVALAVMLLRGPATPRPVTRPILPSSLPAWDDSRFTAADCGLPDAVSCIVETPCGISEDLVVMPSATASASPGSPPRRASPGG